MTEHKEYKHARSVALLLIFVVLMTFSGCANQKTRIVLTTGFDKDEVFRIGSMSCTLPEIMVYLTNTQNQYEQVYGSKIWEMTVDGTSMESNIKDTALARISKIKAMNLLAEEYEVTLSEAETTLAGEAAHAYFTSLNETEMEQLGLTEDIMIKLYSEYALAEKIYEYIISDVTPEISDDEARTITVSQILIKTYYMDVKDMRQKYGTDAKIEIYKKALTVQQKLLEGTDFDLLASEYNEADITSFSFSKGEKEAIYEDTAFNLGTGEISDIIETEDGYVMIRCDNAYNREETDLNKDKILEAKRKQAFNYYYDEFILKLDKDMNDSLWDSITLLHDEQVITSTFFSTYEEYFSNITF